jgi:glycosyltransferase involved in cell wall biosynthesis
MSKHSSSRVITLNSKINHSRNLQSFPMVSFQIPVLNNRYRLKKCLETIMQQDYPSKEVLVIDNGSNDGSPELALELGAEVFLRLGPLGKIRQFGIDISKGEFVALWDSDLYIPRNTWLSENLRRFEMYPQATTLWVRTVAPPGANRFAKAYDWYSWTVVTRLVKRAIGFWGGGASIFRTKDLRQIHQIPEVVDEGEDFYVAKNLASTGGLVLFSDDPLYHDSHRSLGELIRKDVRRVQSFKRGGLEESTGVPLNCLVYESLTVGFIIATANLFRKRQVFFVFAPILVMTRLLAYGILYVIRK